MERLRFLDPPRGAREGGGPPRPLRERARGPAPERLAHGLEAPVRRHAPGHHHRRVVRHVGAAIVVDDLLAGHSRDGLGGAQDRPTVRVLAEVLAGQHAPEGGAGRVGGAADLLQDHVALALDLDRVERGVLRRVGQDVQRGVEAPGGQHDVEVRPVLGGRGVHLAAEAGDRLIDHAGPPRGRPLEEQVLDEVRQPRLVGGLVARARPDPELHRGDLGRVVGLEHGREAVRQADPLGPGTDGTAFGRGLTALPSVHRADRRDGA